ncbi:hypothetical protein Lfu02_31460 [Longispora fulva]|uniref:Uncharacterized protein n=1 Tax=Longispora fulva TaxID=619741 RepID=A0A8J7GT59_9ACTN|nr:hypothetical protein [Longispora fulva]MBG6139280.1 hypothetical protein [Longispora fulva]GIG58774.1 hypothetical protein Lfu02_31460 [Longispora fulva]
MSLAIFGVLLLGGLVGLCWKNSRSTGAAVIAVMLGLTIAGSGGALSEPSKALVGAVRQSLNSIGDSLFGGAK